MHGQGLRAERRAELLLGLVVVVDRLPSAAAADLDRMLAVAGGTDELAQLLELLAALPPAMRTELARGLAAKRAELHGVRLARDG